MRLFLFSFCASLLVFWFGSPGSIAAQPKLKTTRGNGAPAPAPVPSPAAIPVKSASPQRTVVEFELLSSGDGGGLHAQKWLAVLEPLDVSVRIHRPILDDKPELKERESGLTRFVTAIGTLERSGTIVFPNRSFGTEDSVKLKEWINELRTYGIRGAPTGQPLWGLNKEQFNSVYDALVKPVDFETLDLPLTQLIAKLPLPPQYPLRWNAEARDLLAKRGDKTKVRQELRGLSIATVLAITLNENGFGFHPTRTPSGQLELLVEPRDPKSEQWPIGWPIQRQVFKAAPKLYGMIPIELSDVPLSDVLEAISNLSETPVLIDYAELDAKQIQLDKIKVSFPRKVTTWTIALRQLVAPQKMTRELWQDEAGRVFVWITTIRAGRAKENE